MSGLGSDQNKDGVGDMLLSESGGEGTGQLLELRVGSICKKHIFLPEGERNGTDTAAEDGKIRSPYKLDNFAFSRGLSILFLSCHA
ncbi:MAG: hypothetical protein ACWGKN_18055 [Desulfoprunum sp.]|jgi:hypothetical protein